MAKKVIIKSNPYTLQSRDAAVSAASIYSPKEKKKIPLLSAPNPLEQGKKYYGDISEGKKPEDAKKELVEQRLNPNKNPNKNRVYGQGSQVSTIVNEKVESVGTINIPSESGTIKPKATTTTSQTTVNANPVDVSYSKNPNERPSKTNSMMIYTKDNKVIGSSRPDYDLSNLYGLDLSLQYNYNGRIGTGYDLVEQSIEEASKGQRTITETKTTYEYDFDGLKTTSFKNPDNTTSTFAYKEGDVFAVDTLGQVTVFPEGTKLGKGYREINSQGEFLYGGKTEKEIGSFISTQSKTDKLITGVASGFTLSNPFELTVIGEAINFGKNLVSAKIDSIKSYGLKSNDMSKAFLSMRYAGAKQEFSTNLNKIATNSYISSYGKSGQKQAPTKFIITSPPVILAASYGAGALIQSAAITTGVGLSTSTAATGKLASGSLFIAANAGALSIGLSQGVPLALNVYYNKKFEKIDARGGMFGEKFALVGSDIAYFGAGLAGAKAASTGAGLPLMYANVKAEGQVVSEGLFLSRTGQPIITRTATSIKPTGALSYSYIFGSPKTITYPTFTEGLSLSQAQTRADTWFLGRYVNQELSPDDIATFGITDVAAANRNIASNRYIGQDDFNKIIFERKGLSTEQGEALNNWLKKQKGIQYGSSSSRTQVVDLAEPNDIDFRYDFDYAGSTSRIEKGKVIPYIGKAEEAANILNSFERGSAEVKGTQVFFKGEKLFDLHGLDTPPELGNTLGFRELGASKSQGVKTSTLSQEGINTASSVSSLQKVTPEVGLVTDYVDDFAVSSKIIQPTEYNKLPFKVPEKVLTISPTEDRFKDVGKAFMIQKELLSNRAIVNPELTNKLNAYRYSAIEKFGDKAFSKYPNQLFTFSPTKTTTPINIIPSSSSSVVRSSLSSSASLSKSIVPSFSSSFSSSSLYPSRVSFSSSSSSSSSFSPSFSPSFSSVSRISGSSSSGSSSSLSSSSSSSSGSSSSGSSSYFSGMFFPTWPTGMGGRVSSRIIAGGKRITGYTPSLRAFIFKETGTYKKSSLSRSGLDYRPITNEFRRKRRF